MRRLSFACSTPVRHVAPAPGLAVASAAAARSPDPVRRTGGGRDDRGLNNRWRAAPPASNSSPGWRRVGEAALSPAACSLIMPTAASHGSVAPRGAWRTSTRPPYPDLQGWPSCRHRQRPLLSGIVWDNITALPLFGEVQRQRPVVIYLPPLQCRRRQHLPVAGDPPGHRLATLST